MGNGDTDDGLTDAQRNAVVHLLAGKTVRATAKLVGVAECTVHEWRRSEAFRRAHQKARADLFERAKDDLSKIGQDAVAALKRNLRCKVPQAEVRAALGILDKLVQLQTVADLEGQIAELRARLEADGADTRGAEGGTGQAPAEGGDPGGEGKPDPGPPPGGPAPAVPGDGVGGGPVAGAVPLFDG